MILLTVIRKTRDLETMTYPLLLGNVSMKRFKFDILSPEDDQLWTEKERDVSDRERHWNIAALVDPAYGGKGIAVVRDILQSSALQSCGPCAPIKISDT